MFRADIISVSEEESEAPVMWVNNGAYCLSHSDQEIVLSRRGWLTDKIIHAAQILLLQFFTDMAGLQPAVLQKVFAFQVHSGEFVQIIHVRNNTRPLLGVKLGLSMCTTACVKPFQRKQSA